MVLGLPKRRSLLKIKPNRKMVVGLPLPKPTRVLPVGLPNPKRMASKFKPSLKELMQMKQLTSLKGMGGRG